jgi:septation ring formation regulator EzrA
MAAVDSSEFLQEMRQETDIQKQIQLVQMFKKSLSEKTLALERDLPSEDADTVEDLMNKLYLLSNDQSMGDNTIQTHIDNISDQITQLDKTCELNNIPYDQVSALRSSLLDHLRDLNDHKVHSNKM